ncbi:Tryptophan synthase alpha chain [Labilithrix luteola]|uniref:Tryptophan synthase alpha chain n=1 Tax=Labilithrix luteola TaxID=1391654 RepID=A0A0K1PMX6_9BACT|nr:hypothetical protein [Labilithrix luteola]AKU94895.1 Tryptophan synthase alpha chain [Labilithrix luteola]
MVGSVFAAMAVVGTLLACAREPLTLGAGETSETPGFTLPDASTSPVADAGLDVDASVGMCIATQCPAPLATCTRRDGTLPDYACLTDLSNDVLNCGGCNVECRETSPRYNLQMTCVAGECRGVCKPGFVDCNGIPDDGCEANTSSDDANCGACGVHCPSGVACLNGQCGCPPGTTECGGACVDLSSDDFNCGSCGYSCEGRPPPEDAGPLFPHMYLACKDGQCKAPRCVVRDLEFWGDCNKSIDPDGCETDLLRDTSNCGACGVQCAPGQKCFDFGGSIACGCKPGQTLCTGSPGFGDYCTDTENDPSNCGACGYKCPVLANSAAPVCQNGRCKTECVPRTADCNGRDDDGCESDVGHDPRNCGGCGILCDLAAGQPCIGGRCLTKECSGGTTQ